MYLLNHDHGYLTGRLNKHLMLKILLTDKSGSCIYFNNTSNIVIKSIFFRNKYDNNIYITLCPTYKRSMNLTF